MTIATSRKDNSSAATVFYAPTNKGDSLIFVSSSKSEHILNSKINPNCAAAINKDGLEWEGYFVYKIDGNPPYTQEEITFKEGKPHGEWIEYYPLKKIRSLTPYKFDKKNGLQIT